LKHLADLDLALRLVRVGAAFDQLDRFLLGLDLEDPVAGDQLLGFCERAVDHGALVTREPDTRALPSSIRPAFTISSLNFAMAESSSSNGVLPASESLVAFTITMNRIRSSLWRCSRQRQLKTFGSCAMGLCSGFRAPGV